MKPKFEIDPEMYATHGQRIVNFLIDYVCQLMILFFGLMAYIVVLGLSGSSEIPDLERLGTLGRYVIGLVMLLIYYNIFEIFFARTIAKFITNTIVVDEFGEKPSTNAILTRSISRAIPFEFISFLGSPCVGWHDSLSNTYVVQKNLLEEAKRSFYQVDAIGKTDQE